MNTLHALQQKITSTLPNTSLSNIVQIVSKAYKQELLLILLSTTTVGSELFGQNESQQLQDSFTILMDEYTHSKEELSLSLEAFYGLQDSTQRGEHFDDEYYAKLDNIEQRKIEHGKRAQELNSLTQRNHLGKKTLVSYSHKKDPLYRTEILESLPEDWREQFVEFFGNQTPDEFLDSVAVVYNPIYASNLLAVRNGEHTGHGGMVFDGPVDTLLVRPIVNGTDSARSDSLLTVHDAQLAIVHGYIEQLQKEIYGVWGGFEGLQSIVLEDTYGKKLSPWRSMGPHYHQRKILLSDKGLDAHRAMYNTKQGNEILRVHTRHEYFHHLGQSTRLDTQDSIQSAYNNYANFIGMKNKLPDTNQPYVFFSGFNFTSAFAFIAESSFYPVVDEHTGHPWSNSEELFASSLNAMYALVNEEITGGEVAEQFLKKIANKDELSYEESLGDSVRIEQYRADITMGFYFLNIVRKSMLEDIKRVKSSRHSYENAKTFIYIEDILRRAESYLQNCTSNGIEVCGQRVQLYSWE